MSIKQKQLFPKRCLSLATRVCALSLRRPVFRPALTLHYCTLHLRTAANRATGVLRNIFPLLPRDTKRSQKTKTTPCKLIVGSIVTYVVPARASACDSNYLKLQVVENKCLRVTGECLKVTHVSRLHDTFNVEYFQDFIHRFTANFLFISQHVLTSWFKKSDITP
jgi:hypothetical protein